MTDAPKQETPRTVHADPETLAYWRTLPSASNERLAVEIIETLQRELSIMERSYHHWRENALSASRQGDITEAKIAELLTELELLNFMDVGAPRHQRKKEYEHIRAFLISLAPGVVEPNYEGDKHGN